VYSISQVVAVVISFVTEDEGLCFCDYFYSSQMIINGYDVINLRLKNFREVKMYREKSKE